MLPTVEMTVLPTMRMMNQWVKTGRDRMTINMIRNRRTNTSTDIVVKTNDISGLYPAWENPRTHARYTEMPMARRRGLRSVKISYVQNNGIFEA